MPSNSTRPSVGGSKPSAIRPKVDFPDPLSPTSPTVSPRAIDSDTPVTACTGRARDNRPRAANRLLNASAITSSSVMAAPAKEGSATAGPPRP